MLAQRLLHLLLRPSTESGRRALQDELWSFLQCHSFPKPQGLVMQVGITLLCIIMRWQGEKDVQFELYRDAHQCNDIAWS
jgi:hypothetical protein